MRRRALRRLARECDVKCHALNSSLVQSGQTTSNRLDPAERKMAWPGDGSVGSSSSAARMRRHPPRSPRACLPRYGRDGQPSRPRPRRCRRLRWPERLPCARRGCGVSGRRSRWPADGCRGPCCRGRRRCARARCCRRSPTAARGSGVEDAEADGIGQHLFMGDQHAIERLDIVGGRIDRGLARRSRSRRGGGSRRHRRGWIATATGRNRAGQAACAPRGP